MIRSNLYRIIAGVMFLFMAVMINSCKENGISGDDNVITGQITRAQWNDLVRSDADKYTPDSATLQQIQTLMDSGNYTFTMMAGTWSRDSRKELPKFFRLCDSLGIADQNLQLYCVNRHMQMSGGMMGMQNVTDLNKVPTMIIMKDGVEIGRIVDHPKESWEKDMLNIMQQ